MNEYALFRAGVCVFNCQQIVEPPLNAVTPPADLVENTGGVECRVGWTRQGFRQYTRVDPPELTNQRTIEQQADAALAANRTALEQLVAWRSNGPGAGNANLTAAQMSTALRTSADNQIAILRQLNALIRLERGRFDGTD